MTAFVSNDTYGRDTLQQELERDEGVRNTMYKDTRGYWTIGIGHNLSIAQSDFTISALFNDDCNGAEASLDSHWPWWRSLSMVRQRVMLGLMFNLGSVGLSEFPLFLAAMELGNWEAAAAELMNSKYANQVGDRCIRYQYMVLNDSTEPQQV